MTRIAPVTFAALAMVLSGRAAQAHVDGSTSTRSVRLDTPCIAAVHVRLDPSVESGSRYSFDGSAVQTQVDHDTTTLSIPACGAQSLTVRMSPQGGLSIAPSRSTVYDVAGTLGALSASMSGGSLDVEDVQAVHLGLSGTVRVRIGSVGSALQVSASDNAVLSIEHAHANAVSGQFLGHAQANFADGKLDAVNLVTAQHASVTVLGEAQVATLTAHGDSVINVETVTGALLRHGDGGVRVSHYNGMIIDRRDAGLPMPGAPQPPSPPVPPPGEQP